jgi:hypothetical protein
LVFLNGDLQEEVYVE